MYVRKKFKFEIRFRDKLLNNKISSKYYNIPFGKSKADTKKDFFFESR